MTPLVIVRPERFVVLRTAQTNRKRLMAPMFVVGLMHGNGQSFLAKGLGLDHTKSAFFDVRNIAAGWVECKGRQRVLYALRRADEDSRAQDHYNCRMHDQ